MPFTNNQGIHIHYEIEGEAALFYFSMVSIGRWTYGMS